MTKILLVRGKSPSLKVRFAWALDVLIHAFESRDTTCFVNLEVATAFNVPKASHTKPRRSDLGVSLHQRAVPGGGGFRVARLWLSDGNSCLCLRKLRLKSTE